MKQPTIPPPRPTRERIRAVALELFARHGYGGASMSELARGVGVQKATLYNYYDSKESLLLDLLEAGLEAWSEASRAALNRSGPLSRRLKAHLGAVLVYAKQHPHEAALVWLAATQIGGDLGAEVRRRLDERKAVHSIVLEREFAAAIECGEVRATDPEDLARTWRALMSGLLTQQLFEGVDEDPGEMLDRIWQIVWKGMAVEEDRE